jgi:hypothetical protein
MKETLRDGNTVALYTSCYRYTPNQKVDTMRSSTRKLSFAPPAFKITAVTPDRALLCVYTKRNKLVHTLNISLDRESNPRPLAYGNTASIKGTTTLTTKLSPLLQNRKFNDQGRTQCPSMPCEKSPGEPYHN